MVVDSKLTHLLESVLGKGRTTNKGHMAFCCPFCQTSKKKLEIQTILDSHGEMPWHCWVCNKAGKKLTSLFKTLNLGRAVMSELYSIIGLQPKYTKSERDEFRADTHVVELPKEFIPLWKPSESVEYKNAIHYLRAKRKVSLSEIVKYNIGYCEAGEYAKKIIVPSYNDLGKLNYFVGRDYYDGEGFKHKNPDVSKNIISNELFINWSLPIVICEGMFDAIAIRRNVIPLLGKTISEKLKIKIVEYKVSQLFICLDKDAQKQALVHAEYFMNSGVEVYFVNLNEKDPADIGFERMCKLIKDTMPLTFSSLIKMKLNGLSKNI